MAEFMANLDRINQLADQTPGFVWRMQGDEENARALEAFENPRFIINMSVWESIEQLHHYTYRSSHVDILRRRSEWFKKVEGHHLALWWIPVGTIPTAIEAKARMDHIQINGPTAIAFSFQYPFPVEQSDPSLNLT